MTSVDRPLVKTLKRLSHFIVKFQDSLVLQCFLYHIGFLHCAEIYKIQNLLAKIFSPLLILTKYNSFWTKKCF